MNRNPEGSELSISQLEEKIAVLEKRKETYDDMLDELDERGVKQFFLTDPDSLRMQASRGQDICYNVQNAVDEKHNLIVVYHVTNEVTDQNQLSSMAKESKAFLQNGSRSAFPLVRQGKLGASCGDWASPHGC